MLSFYINKIMEEWKVHLLISRNVLVGGPASSSHRMGVSWIQIVDMLILCMLLEWRNREDLWLCFYILCVSFFFPSDIDIFICILYSS